MYVYMYALVTMHIHIFAVLHIFITPARTFALKNILLALTKYKLNMFVCMYDLYIQLMNFCCCGFAV